MITSHFLATAATIATGPAKSNVVCDVAGSVPLVGGLLGGGCDLTSMLTGFAGELFKLFTNFPGFLHDFANNFIFKWFFPKDAQNYLFGVLGMNGSNTRDYSNVYQNLFISVSGIGLAIAVAAAGARVMRTLLDQRSTSMQLILDVIVRFGVVAVLIAPIGNQVPLGFSVLKFALQASSELTAAVGHQLGQASLQFNVKPGEGPVQAMLQKFTNNEKDIFAFVIGCIPVIIFAIYAFVLVIIRGLLIAFCVATAPLCIATAVFDTRNKFFAWWMDIFVGSLMIGLVLSAAFFISLTLASAMTGGLMGGVFANIIFCGSIWMAGKMVHQLTWKHFSHGGALGAFGAAMGVVAVGAKVGYGGEMLTKEGSKANSMFKQLANWGTSFGMGFPAGGRGGHGGAAGGAGAGGGGGPAALTGRALQGMNKASGGSNGHISGGESALPDGGAGFEPALSDFGYNLADYMGSADMSQEVGGYIQQLAGGGVGMTAPQKLQGAWDQMGKSDAGRQRQSQIAASVMRAQLHPSYTAPPSASNSGGNGNGGNPNGGGPYSPPPVGGSTATPAPVGGGMPYGGTDSNGYPNQQRMFDPNDYS